VRERAVKVGGFIRHQVHPGSVGPPEHFLDQPSSDPPSTVGLGDGHLGQIGSGFTLDEAVCDEVALARFSMRWSCAAAGSFSASVTAMTWWRMGDVTMSGW
jgi:hypothetical protein